MGSSPFKIYTDRSALIDHQACQRLGFWSREFGKGMVLPSATTARLSQVSMASGNTVSVSVLPSDVMINAGDRICFTATAAGAMVTVEPTVHPGGISPARKSIYLVIGGAIHTGLNYLMERVQAEEFASGYGDALKTSVQNLFQYDSPQERQGHLVKEPSGYLNTEMILAAADLALAEFNQSMADGSISVPDAQTPEQREWKLREAQALVEGLVMVAGFRLVPNLVERFRVVEVEQEKRFLLTTMANKPRPAVFFNPATITDEMVQAALKSAPGQIMTLTPKQQEDLLVMMTSQPVEVWFESRADALLEERATGDLYVHSWKTAADYGRMEAQQFRRDVQGLSEAIAIEAAGIWTPTGETPPKSARIQGIQMAFLLKGRKSRQADPAGGGSSDWGDAPDWHGLGPGLRWHQSPLVHGWRMASHGILPDQDESQWAWSYTFPKAENKSGKGRLGKGWEPMAIFDGYPGGTRQWILDLIDGRWQPECGDPLASCVAMPEPWSRADREMVDWREQAEAMVAQIVPKADEVREAMGRGDWEGARRLLNRNFPQDRKSCYSFGSPCWAEALCFGPDEVWQDPLENGYALRSPHHPGADNGGGE